MKKWRSTTILALRRGSKVVICGDGQVSFGNAVIKSTSHKVRKIADGKILAGYAGSASDGMALLERLEMKLNQYSAQLMRSCIELAKDWRTDKYLRRLEAMIIVADAKNTFIISGSGDVLEPEYGVAGIGSGGNYAVAAARALMEVSNDMDLVDMAHRAMNIAASICVFTNTNVVTEVLDGDEATKEPGDAQSPAGSSTKRAGSSTKTSLMKVEEHTEVQPYVDSRNIESEDIYCLAAAISVLSTKVSAEYITGIIRSVYPKLGSVTLKTRQAVKRLAVDGILKKAPGRNNEYTATLHSLEGLKSKGVSFAKIKADAINAIKKLVS